MKTTNILIFFLTLLLAGALAACTTPAPPAPPASPPPPIIKPEVKPEPAPEIEVKPKPKPEPAPEPASPPLPELAEEVFRYAEGEERQVAARLGYHRDRERHWRELEGRLTALVGEGGLPDRWRQCREQLTTVVTAYQQAQDRLRDLQFGDFADLPAGAAAVAVALRADLEFGAGRCAEIEQQAEITVAAELDRFHTVASEQLQAVALHHAGQGRAAEAAAALDNLARLYPERQLPPHLVSEAALALTRAGAGEEALRLLARHRRTAAKPDFKPDPARLEADLLLLAGRGDEARKLYGQIAARHAAGEDERRWIAEQLALLRGEVLAGNVERELFLEMVRDYILFDGRAVPPRLPERLARLERLYPGGMLTHRGRLLLDRVKAAAVLWLEEQQREIEELLARRDYEPAIARLEELAREELTPPKRDWVREQLALALKAQREAEEQRRFLEQQALTIQWEEANRLLGLRRFDEAITAFSQLLATEYGGEARRRIAEASLEAATEIRREAAGLFVRARRSEPRQGLELALESWRLLRRIIERYPASEIVSRVRDNLQSVEEYLESLEPGLVDRLREDGAEGELELSKVGEE